MCHVQGVLKNGDTNRRGHNLRTGTAKSLRCSSTESALDVCNMTEIVHRLF